MNVSKSLGLVTAIMLALLSVITFLQVILRYAFQSPIFWAEELARYLLIWVSLTGATIAVAQQANIRIGFFVNITPKCTQKVISILVPLLCIGFLIIIGSKGVGIAISAFTDRSPALGLPIGFVYLSLPVNALIMIIYLLIQMFGIIRQEYSQPNQYKTESDSQGVIPK